MYVVLEIEKSMLALSEVEDCINILMRGEGNS